MIIFPAGVGSVSSSSRDEFLDKYSVNFDGSNDYILVNNDASLTFGDGSNDSPFSISAWIKADDFSGFRILTKNEWNSSTNYREYLFHAHNGYAVLGLVDAAGGVNAYNNYRYRQSSSSGSLQMSTGVWYHVVGTYDGRGGTNAHQGIKLYINGVLETNYTDSTGGTYVAMHNNTGSNGDIAIGAWSNSSFTNGKITQVGIWNRVLSSKEVKLIYDRPNNLGLNSNYKSYSSSGLVGYWPMLEGSGTTTIDRSTNTNDGTLTNGPTWSYATASKSILESKYSINFDGTNDHLVTAFNTNDHNLINGFTISAWVYLDDNSTTQDFFGRYGSSTARFYFGINGSKVRAAIGNSYDESSLSHGMSTGKWHHVAYTFSGGSSGTFTFYLDGLSVGTITFTWTGDSGSNEDVHIGGLNNGGNDYQNPFNGKMTDLAFFTSAASKTEISSIYNNGNLLDLSVDSGDYEFSSNLVAYWRMNEGTGTSTKDIIGAKNGTLTNSPTWDKSLPFKADNYSVYLDGSDDIIDLTTFDPSSIIGTGAFTMSMWMKAHSDANQIFWYMGNSGITTMMRMNYLASSGGFKIWANIDGTWTNQYPHVDITTETGVWYHVAVVRSGTTVTLYVNGTNSDSKTHSSLATGFGTEHHIGKYMTSHHLNGNIGQYALWNKALTSSEIVSIYNDGTPIDLSFNYQNYNSINNLVGYWGMNEGSGDSLIAKSVRTGVDFDGANDYALVNNDSSLTFGDGSNDSPFSISAWINMDDATKFRIFSKQTNSANIEYVFGVDGLDRLAVNLYDGSTSNYRGVYSSSIQSYEGSWIHVVMTYDGRGGNSAYDGMKLYLNGDALSTSMNAGNGYTAMHSTTTDVWIGAANFTPDYANGKIDDVALFNIALPISDIKSMYNNGFPTDLTINTANYRFAANLIGYWKMGSGREAGSGTTIYDMSTNSNNATLTNGPTFNTEAGTVGTLANGPTWSNDSWNTLTKQTRNYSIDFDGTNDYVRIPDDDAFSFGDGSNDSAFSISTWINIDTLLKFRIATKATSASVKEWLLTVDGASDLFLYLHGQNSANFIARGYTTNLPTGQWIYITATYDGSSNASGIKIYLNGAQVDNQTYTGGTYQAMYPTASDVWIGGLEQVPDYANGKVKDFAIFNRELSADAVKSIYNDGEVIDLTKEYGHYKPKNNLIAYYQMEEGEGTILMDRTGNGRNGTLTNGPTYSTSTP